MKRITKQLSLNQKEANEIWLPAWKVHGEVENSMTLKRCCKSAIKLDRIETLAKERGISDIELYLKVMKEDEKNES